MTLKNFNKSEENETILFTKADCQKCDYVKSKIPEKMELRILDMATTDGMAHAAYHELLEKHAPILVHNDEPIEGAIKIKKKLDELAKLNGKSKAAGLRVEIKKDTGVN